MLRRVNRYILIVIVVIGIVALVDSFSTKPVPAPPIVQTVQNNTQTAIREIIVLKKHEPTAQEIRNNSAVKAIRQKRKIQFMQYEMGIPKAFNDFFLPQVGVIQKHFEKTQAISADWTRR